MTRFVRTARWVSTSAAKSAPSLHVTERCASRINALIAQRKHHISLRVSVDSGGCSGFQYAFHLEESMSTPGDGHGDAERQGETQRGQADAATAHPPDDFVFKENGAEVRVDPVSFAFLKGATVDYVEEMMSSSFRVVENPNSEAGCGCGTSFSAKAD